MYYDEDDALIQHIYAKTQGNTRSGGVMTGVCLRTQDENGGFKTFPYEQDALRSFEAAVIALNPAVAVKLHNAAVQSTVAKLSLDEHVLVMDQNTRIQVLETLADLRYAEKDQCGAFIRDEGTLIVWTDALDTIMALCEDFEEKLMKLIWRTRTMIRSSSTVHSRSMPSLPNHSTTSLTGSSLISSKEKVEQSSLAPDDEAKPSPWWHWRVSHHSERANGQTRKTILFAPFYAGVAAGLTAFFVFNGVATLLGEYALDGSAARFGFVGFLPLFYCIALFFCMQFVGNLSLIVGPVAQYHQNSKYYSARKPEASLEVDNNLPHVTIQLPVYKESLELTIAPSVFSIKKAMQTYARQGGTSSIFVCDDGLQVLGEEEREERIRFYANHGIGWVARPGHGSNKDENGQGYERRGRFKKASNMNYGLSLSLRLERHLADLEASGATEESLGESLEDHAMKMAQDDIFEESGRRYPAWAAGGKALRVGEIILIVDSDTIVPEDCFRDAAREMAASPEVAIIQHESDVMQVAHHYFENGITHFTRRINRCISMGCANGEVAPFVGHNAFLRWSAVQDVSFLEVEPNMAPRPCPRSSVIPDASTHTVTISTGTNADAHSNTTSNSTSTSTSNAHSNSNTSPVEVRRFWSESHVSEDFDMALRLLLKNYTVRWATYSAGGFKEGVSLTVVDELARWQKYAYGCDELIFNPIVEWWRKSPISKQLRVFVWSKAPVHYKLGMMAYMFSYYGIAAGALLSLVNYVVLGLISGVDRFYMSSFELMLACTFVFFLCGNVGFTLMEYRTGSRGILASLGESLKWVPFFLVFFGGMSIHVSTAILAHLFSFNMTWGSTTKEVEKSTFWIEVPRILRRFWLSLVLSALAIATMVVFNTGAVPEEWQIPATHWPLIVPMASVAGFHVLLPIVLNPWLMIFSY